MKIATAMIVYNEVDIVNYALNDDLYNWCDLQVIIDSSPDGSSTDGTGEFLDEYKKGRDKVILVHGKIGSWEAQDNFNIVARNTYLSLISQKYDWITLVDADEVHTAENLMNLREHMLLTIKPSLKFDWIAFYGDFWHTIPTPRPSRVFRNDPTLWYPSLDVQPYTFCRPGCGKGKPKNVFSDNEVCGDVTFMHYGHSLGYDKEFRRVTRYAKRGQPRVSDPEAYARRTLVNYPYHKGRKLYTGEQPEIMKKHPLYKENYADPPRGLD